MYGALNISNPLHFSPKTQFGFLLKTGGFPVKNHKNRNFIRAVSVAAAPESMVATSRGGSLYSVLRLEPTATMTEIKSAYRSLAKMYHPDLSVGGCGQDFIEIHNAYATLSDPAARAVYDLSLVSRTRRRPSSSSSAVGYSGRSGFYSSRRWETDQCW